MKTFKECLNDAAKEYGGSFIDARTYDQISIRMANEAAELYANEKLKGLLEEVREFESDLSKFGNLMNGQFSKTFINGFTAHQIHIAARIEELINETK